eukprot:3208635-Pleurochrysis_carterae.AAC.1
MQEIIALRSKVYAYKYSADPTKCKKTLKGVGRVCKEHLQFKHYERALHESRTTYVNQQSIRSYKHCNYTILQRKKALCAYDDKRYILEDGVQTLAYGHWRLNKTLLPCQLPTQEEIVCDSLAEDDYKYIEDPGDMFDD